MKTPHPYSLADHPTQWHKVGDNGFFSDDGLGMPPLPSRTRRSDEEVDRFHARIGLKMSPEARAAYHRTRVA